MINIAWTPKRIEQLRALASAGESGKQAGEVLHVSRSNCIAAARRNGFNFASGPTVKPWPADRIEQLRTLAAEGKSSNATGEILGVSGRTARYWADRNGIRFKRAPPPPPRYKQPKPPEVAHGGGITIIDLTETTCRWPYGDPADLSAFRYCGLHIIRDGQVYCSGHHALAYQPRTPMMRRAA